LAAWRRQIERVSGSVDNMSPESDFIPAVNSTPIIERLAAHSIIAIDGDGPLEEASDGVVTYQNAHIDGVTSEFIVPSPHTCLGHPATIGELRRIMLDHIGMERMGLEDLTRSEVVD
jgi:hypothetical protein